MKDRDFHLRKMYAMTGPASSMAAAAETLLVKSFAQPPHGAFESHPTGPLLLHADALRAMDETRAILDELQARAGEWEWPAP